MIKLMQVGTLFIGSIALVLALASCSVVEKKFDEKTAGALVKIQDELCTHSKAHQDLIIDEINERLDRIKLVNKCQ